LTLHLCCIVKLEKDDPRVAGGDYLRSVPGLPPAVLQLTVHPRQLSLQPPLAAGQAGVLGVEELGPFHSVQ